MSGYLQFSSPSPYPTSSPYPFPLSSRLVTSLVSSRLVRLVPSLVSSRLVSSRLVSFRPSPLPSLPLFPPVQPCPVRRPYLPLVPPTLSARPDSTDPWLGGAVIGRGASVPPPPGRLSPPGASFCRSPRAIRVHRSSARESGSPPEVTVIPPASPVVVSRRQGHRLLQTAADWP